MASAARTNTKVSIQVLQREAASLMNQEYFSEEVFPSVTGLNLSATGKIIRGKLANNYGDKNANHIRLPGQKYHRQQALRFDSVAYATRQYGSSFALAEENEEAENSDIDEMSENNNALISDLLIRRDRDTATFLTDNSTNGWGTLDLSGSPGDQFTNAASNPMKIINVGRKAVEKFKPVNFIVVGWDVGWALLDNDYLLERSATTEGRQTMNKSDLKRLLSAKLDIPTVILARSHFNNAALGQTEDIDPIFAKHIFLGYRAENPYDTYSTKFGSVRTAASCARRLRLKDITVRQYFDEDTDSTVVKSKWTETLAAVNPELGYLIKNAVA
jgi:hypothetical protein